MNKFIKGLCVTALAFCALAVMVTLALNLSFLNPVSQAVRDFSLTDIYYNALKESGEADTSRVITIVDMTQLYDRGEIADVLEAINQCEPRAIGVDVVFEGLRDDSLADRRIADVASASHTTVFSYKLLDYLNDEIGYTKSVHSFFTDTAAVHEGFTNMERKLYGGMKRQLSLGKKYEGEVCASFFTEVMRIYTGEDFPAENRDLDINFSPRTFRVIPADSVFENAEYLKDGIVLLGAMYEEGDMHYTPLGKIAGTELLAYALQTLLEQSEVRHPNTLVTFLASFLIVLFTYMWRNAYLRWAKSRKSEVRRFFLTTTFLMGLMMSAWMAFLGWIGFIVFCLTHISFNLGWGFGAIPFLGGAKEFYEMIETYKNTKKNKQNQEL